MAQFSSYSQIRASSFYVPPTSDQVIPVFGISNVDWILGNWQFSIIRNCMLVCLTVITLIAVNVNSCCVMNSKQWVNENGMILILIRFDWEKWRQFFHTILRGKKMIGKPTIPWKRGGEGGGNSEVGWSRWVKIKKKARADKVWRQWNKIQQENEHRPSLRTGQSCVGYIYMAFGNFRPFELKCYCVSDTFRSLSPFFHYLVPKYRVRVDYRKKRVNELKFWGSNLTLCSLISISWVFS